ncbi:MAG: DUF192 domain-containing protein [Bacteroidales bacterium]|jgi:hypothetical protein|nr:DUF192 domain-containing protein [Bacteroidales bacterium]MDD2571156.1 DUF192 domain-containing protein [Bacteroidales bacterium]MDD2813014.1 DUF192 domain-containing protein [Bacteroidales bacterium]MDD3386175.1 DUF192 domain-containing protein [Bacteroidales bacterium]MDD3812118.1 DUF192 domain-containing protein [Bacteroidales bacterium]
MVNLRDKQKSSSKIQSRYKKSRQKPIIYLTLLLLVVMIMFVLYNPNRQDRRSRQTVNEITQESATGFTREGELRFLKADSTEVTAIDIEIADDDYRRELGLMYRRQMEQHQGMLFIFEEEDYRSFWMKNTYLPLDILYADATKRIVRIHENVPILNEEQIPSDYPAKYVIEVNAGFCALHNIKSGDLFTFSR